MAGFPIDGHIYLHTESEIQNSAHIKVWSNLRAEFDLNVFLDSQTFFATDLLFYSRSGHTKYKKNLESVKKFPVHTIGPYSAILAYMVKGRQSRTCGRQT